MRMSLVILVLGFSQVSFADLWDPKDPWKSEKKPTETKPSETKPEVKNCPIVPVSKETRDVAQLLLNKQLQKCVAEFQESEAQIVSVEIKTGDAKTTWYKIIGQITSNGLLAAGPVELVVRESKVKSPFGGEQPGYECQVKASRKSR